MTKPIASDTVRSGEIVTHNGIDADVRLTICVPAFRDDAGPLIKQLTRLPDAKACALMIYDDGSNFPAMTNSIVSKLSAYPGPATLISATANHGRAHARNRLTAHATTDWILLLDADMLPDSEAFLQTYFQIIQTLDEPALIVGGFSLAQAQIGRQQALHAAQSRKSECLAATTRQTQPGLYVFSSNILAHKDVLAEVTFDRGFKGWGWEDTDWGIRVSEHFHVRHIDNTATHLGLDTTKKLIGKYAASAQNFARLITRHPRQTADMPLLKAAHLMRKIPLCGLIRRITKSVACDPLGITPMRLRLAALKVFRAASYAKIL